MKVTSQASPHIKINNVLFIFYIFGNNKDSFKVSSSTEIAYFMSGNVTKVYICRTTSVSPKNSAKDPASRTTHDSNIQENVRTGK